MATASSLMTRAGRLHDRVPGGRYRPDALTREECNHVARIESLTRSSAAMLVSHPSLTFRAGEQVMPNQIRQVGVVGLGAMGMGIAQSLLRAGFEVHACDVRPEAVAKIVEAGAQGADTPAALGARVEALVIVVVTAQQTDTVLFGDQGAAATMPSGSIVISSATVSGLASA